MQHRRTFILAFLLVVFAASSLSQSPQSSSKEAEEIIDKVKANFFKIKDATADITLDYNLYLFGCAGNKRVYGNGYFKSPDKMQGVIDGDTYFVKGNDIRKIRKDGNKFYVRFINSIDFSIGLHPGLITHNFFINIIKNEPDEIIIEGIPKPGILKNAKKVLFKIDPKKSLLREIDVKFGNQFLGGKIKINYEKIDGHWVPVGCEGESAIELRSSVLIGYGFKLKGSNFKINTGLSDDLFKPGF